MGFLEAVQTGAIGLRLALPGRFAIEEERENSADLMELDQQAALMLFHFDLQLDLRPEHQELLVHDIKLHAREMFANHFAVLQGQRHAAPPAAQRPRTDDPNWSPVVSIERVLLDTSVALSIVHRMAYEPGLEVLMGHLLVPLQSGLFEFRILAGSRDTGVRESQLFAQAIAKAGVKSHEEAQGLMRSLSCDDPQHDSLFPRHPLSVVRSMLRMLATPGVIQRTQPEPLAPSNVVVLPEIGCTITPPRRYVQTPGSAGTSVRFSRVAFAGGPAGTDGVQELLVMRLAKVVIPEGPQRLKTLVANAEDLARGLSEGAPGARVEAWTSDGEWIGEHALAHTEFHPGVHGALRQRHVLGVFTGAGDVEQIFMIKASSCVPKAELLEELNAVLQSWRPLGATRPSPIRAPPPAREPEKKKKKWWFF